MSGAVFAGTTHVGEADRHTRLQQRLQFAGAMVDEPFLATFGQRDHQWRRRGGLRRRTKQQYRDERCCRAPSAG